ncbi:hypothetical protein CQW23_35359 [Capsicum baccatum]|uniref:Uncharacterized protein n=1 Tax=Capsicum baccatum TaxID=33114 RepID=A0A2G2UWH8_CAPBA|nr:hypothetical protein CQW23_35359 [Capsicum baccatum]
MGSLSPNARWAVAATTKRVELQPPFAATSVNVDSHLGQLRARGLWEACRRALGLMASGATCVQRLDGSRDSAIHTKYRIFQCSSSMRELRYPLPRVVFIYRRSTGPPDARRGRGAKGRLSIQVAMFFINARAEISIAESRFRLQKKHRSPRRTPRTGREGQAIDSSIPWRFPRRGWGDALVRSAGAPRPRGLLSC